MDLTTSERDTIFRDITADKVGVVKLDDWKETETYARVRELMPATNSVILLASEVFPEIIRYFTSRRTIGDLHLSDLATRNMELVNGHLDWDAYTITQKLHGLGFQGIPTPAGGAPVSNRDIRGIMPFGLLAEMAGLGKIGWHSMLMTPEYGARIRLSALLTDAPLPATKVGEQYYPCPECQGACVKICPVNAITPPKDGERPSIDRYKCNNTIESSGGCSECLKVCPAGRKKTR